MIPSLDSVRYLPVTALKDKLAAGARLIDVRTPEVFSEGHIPGAFNHCVYEVAFLDEVKKALPETDAAIIVYGESDRFKAAEAAFGRLSEAGYTNVKVLKGGLDKWLSEHDELATSGELSPPPVLTGRLRLDREKSRLAWTGRNLTNRHYGQIRLQSGWIDIDDAMAPGAGEVIADMKGITCEDITDSKMNGILIGHLSNADFFLVDKYPVASFRLHKATPIKDASPGLPNFAVSGEMTIRGVTRPLEFDAMLNPVEEGVSFQANLELNRVSFGAVYGSGSLFERLGMHLVNDLVTIQVSAIFKARRH